MTTGSGSEAPPPELSRAPVSANRSPTRFPDFLCIGVHKAGTTWLHQNLRRHPHIWLPPIKELQYFNHLYIPGHQDWTDRYRLRHAARALRRYFNSVPEEKWDSHYISRTAEIIAGQLSDSWYGSIFTLANIDQVCGEIAPGYSLLPRLGIEHILRLAPGVKIVLALRDPIERNWSHIRMLLQEKQRGPADDAQIIAMSELSAVMAPADYPSILARWSELVPAERFFLMTLDEIGECPVRLMSDICNFLGVDDQPKFFTQLDRKVHIGEQLDIPPAVYNHMKNQLKSIYDALAVTLPKVGETWRSRHYMNR
jgi:hypothetical protein